MGTSLARKKVLVTGGAGFIGSELTRQLIAKKANVTVFDNLSFGSKKNIWSGSRLVRGDIRSHGDLRRVFKESYDLVFHLAAIHFIPYCNSHPLEAISVNIEGTHALLDALTRKPPGRLFFASTAAVYDITSKYHREDEMPAPMDIYGVSKLAGEFLIQQYQRTTGVPCAIGRLFNAYGPRETNPHLVPEIIRQLKQGKDTLRLGNLSPYRDYIHTLDMADAIFRLTMKAGSGRVIANITSGDEYSVREVVGIFSKILHRRLHLQSIAKKRRRLERKHLRGNLGTLTHLTGFKPRISFISGIRDLLQSERLVVK